MLPHELVLMIASHCGIDDRRNLALAHGWHAGSLIGRVRFHKNEMERRLERKQEHMYVFPAPRNIVMIQLPVHSPRQHDILPIKIFVHPDVKAMNGDVFIEVEQEDTDGRFVRVSQYEWMHDSWVTSFAERRFGQHNQTSIQLKRSLLERELA